MGAYKYIWREKNLKIAQKIAQVLGDSMELPITRSDEQMVKDAHDWLLDNNVSEALSCLQTAKRENPGNADWQDLYTLLLDNETQRIKETLKTANGKGTTFLFQELPALIKAGLPVQMEREGDQLHISITL
jgi:hypothetical protein